MYRVEQSSFRVIIAGDRNWSDLDLERKIRQLLLLLLLQLPRDPQGNWNVEIVHGACSGVDQTAGRIARELGHSEAEFPADWQKYGRVGTRRCSITSAREAVEVFHKRIYESKGTKNMLDQTKAKGVPYLLFY